MDKFYQNFFENYKPEQNLDFDKSIIAYYGEHSCKSFKRRKSIRFGLRIRYVYN